MKFGEMRPDPILLAEDNQDHAHLVLRAFHHGGLINPIFVTEDGVETIGYLSGEGKFSDRERYPLPALLLLDLKMPNTDGFEVLRWVRSQPKLSRLPVVVLAGSGEISDVNRAYDLGANSFLVKPLRMDVPSRLIPTVLRL